jgi:hypothetical protein
LDDLSPPLKLFLRAVGEADVDALYEIHPGQLLDWPERVDETLHN